MSVEQLISRLAKERVLPKAEFISLLKHHTKEDDEKLFALARQVRKEAYGDVVYVRGLIEFTNICRNDCYYCGIRCSNTKVTRYRLTKEEILSCCQEGEQLGFRTFVLQGGEDPYFSVDKLCDIVSAIKRAYPHCAVTLSVGERTREDYQRLFDAGADRYLLRHETATQAHYRLLHPEKMLLEQRKQCLYDLRDIGYQVGAGFMVGSPHQTLEHLAEDLLFLHELAPHMVGIGPFIPHQDTPFGTYPAGTLQQTVFLIGVLRLMFPYGLIPATTALGTIHPNGRELGILAGANVVMPNLSPLRVREQYALYDHKLCTGAEAAEHLNILSDCICSVGCQMVQSRGDYREA